MRGKPRAGRILRTGCRIIPAHAGQTGNVTPACRSATDHPRACGANYCSAISANHVPGSSPRMRGKPKADAGDVETRRIIPAHAGQTRFHSHPEPFPPDHPRACGANSRFLLFISSSSGSSPRMRGKLSAELESLRTERIIPAHAGQTRPARRTTPKETDHPRACGANDHDNDVAALDGGSSPRMRGKRRPGIRRPRHRRIIPAHAGQTCSGKSPRT